MRKSIFVILCRCRVSLLNKSCLEIVIILENSNSLTFSDIADYALHRGRLNDEETHEDVRRGILILFYIWFYFIVFNQISNFSLCVHLSSTILYSSSYLWLLLLAGFLFVFFILNKRFFLSRFALMSENK